MVPERGPTRHRLVAVRAQRRSARVRAPRRYGRRVRPRAANPQHPVGMARGFQWAAGERLTAAADILRTSPQASRWAELVEDMSRSAP